MEQNKFNKGKLLIFEESWCRYHMAKLEDIKKDVFEYSKDKVTLFPIQGGMSFFDNVAVSSIEDWKEFFVIMEKLKTDIIYYSESFGDGDHVDELERIEFAFIYNNILHVFRQFADWYEEIDSSEEKQSKIAEEIINEKPEELSKQILEFAKKTDYDLENLDFFNITQLGREYLEERGIEINELPQILRMKIENKLQAARSIIGGKLAEESINKEAPLIPKLVEEGVKWAQENFLNKLNKSNLRTFLAVKDAKLSTVSQDKLYFLINQSLKNKK